MTALPGRAVYVVGGGLSPYRRMSETSYVELGLVAVRAALADADVSWHEISAAYVGSANIGMAAGTSMLRYLGRTCLAVTQVENASASGSSAFRQAVMAVAGGFDDVVLALGVDKPDRRPGGVTKAGVPDLVARLVPPIAGFGLAARRYTRDHGVTPAQLAQVAIKNHRNGASNPHAQRRRVRGLDEILASPVVADPLTRLQCAPRGEGAAAVIVMSEEAVQRYGVERARAVSVRASVCRTAEWSDDVDGWLDLTATTTARACEQAGVEPAELDVIELHDATSIEELLYLEAMGVCEPGKAAADLGRGLFDIGGVCAVSPSGGLLAMGHPIGPTGVGQIVEIHRQLTGRAGARQQADARVAGPAASPTPGCIREQVLQLGQRVDDHARAGGEQLGRTAAITELPDTRNAGVQGRRHVERMVAHVDLRAAPADGGRLERADDATDDVVHVQAAAAETGAGDVGRPAGDENHPPGRLPDEGQQVGRAVQRLHEVHAVEKGPAEGRHGLIQSVLTDRPGELLSERRAEIRQYLGDVDVLAEQAVHAHERPRGRRPHVDQGEVEVETNRRAGGQTDFHGGLFGVGGARVAR